MGFWGDVAKQTVGRIPVVGGAVYGYGDVSSGQQYGTVSNADVEKYQQDKAAYDAQVADMAQKMGTSPERAASVLASIGVRPPAEPEGFSEQAFVTPEAATQQYGMQGVAGTYADRRTDPALQHMLERQARGTAPSAAQIQMEDALRRQQAQAMGMAASDPNVAPALAQRQAMMAANQAGLQTQSQMAALRADEQARAQQALSQYLFQQQGANDQMVQFFMNQGLSRDQAQLQANMALQQMQFQAHESQQGRTVAAEQAAQQGQIARDTSILAGTGQVIAAKVGQQSNASGGGGGGGAPAENIKM